MMAKIRFYCDVPDYRGPADTFLFASTKPNYSVNRMQGITRVAFDVDLPPELYRSFDVAAPATPAMVVAADADEEHSQ